MCVDRLAGHTAQQQLYTLKLGNEEIHGKTQEGSEIHFVYNVESCSSDSQVNSQLPSYM